MSECILRIRIRFLFSLLKENRDLRGVWCLKSKEIEFLFISTNFYKHLFWLISVDVLLPWQEKYEPLNFLQQCEVPLVPSNEGGCFECQQAIADFWIKLKNKYVLYDMSWRCLLPWCCYWYSSMSLFFASLSFLSLF